MKFYIKHIILWMKNGNIRYLDFAANKVNVITGGSNTGKSAIFYIIDYCFLASEAKIAQEVINENVSWYGINFYINNKCYTIARKSLTNFGEVSREYYFSSFGDIPDKPECNISEPDLKLIIEKEFSIDPNIVFPFGGTKIKTGSKISFRYFLMFNTQGENVIINSDTFFDKQQDKKYQEALERIFDLAIGIDTVKDIILKEKITEIEKEINRLERKKKAFEKESLLFEKEIMRVLRLAKEYELIDNLSDDLDVSLKKLKNVIALNIENDGTIELNDELEKLKTERLEIKRKIRNLKKFQQEYDEYKKVMTNNEDSLKPIVYIENNYGDILDTPIVKEFIIQLKQEFLKISTMIRDQSPINLDVLKYITQLELELSSINTKIDLFAQTSRNFNDAKDKYIFIGEIKNKIATYEKNWNEESYDEDLQQKHKELANLHSHLDNRQIRKDGALRLLESFIDDYLEWSSEALENYAGYKAAFDYKEKSLNLQKPKTTEITGVVGSSSNHLFLHLTMFLGIHELIISQDVPYVPPFMILDQPSRPYYDNEREEAKDKRKITIAIKLLNDFIAKINTEYKREFQFIVLEHIPKTIWEDEKMENIHLVSEFIGKEKLVREEDKLE